MRAIVLAVVAIQIGLAYPAHAEDPADADRSIGESLPLFEVTCQLQHAGPAPPLPAVPYWLPHMAKTGDAIPSLLAELASQLRPAREFVELAVPHEASAVIARLHAVAQVVEREYEGVTARFKARIPPHLREEFAPFIVSEINGSIVTLK